MLKWAWKRESKAHIACKSHVFFPAHWRVGEFYYYVVCYNADIVRQNPHSNADSNTQTNVNSGPVTTATILYIRGNSETFARVLQSDNIQYALNKKR